MSDVLERTRFGLLGGTAEELREPDRAFLAYGDEVMIPPGAAVVRLEPAGPDTYRPPPVVKWKFHQDTPVVADRVVFVVFSDGREKRGHVTFDAVGGTLRGVVSAGAICEVNMLRDVTFTVR